MDELQAARERVAELERKEQLTKRKAELEKELAAVNSELRGVPNEMPNKL